MQVGRGFLVGIVSGVAISIVALQVWSGYLERTEALAAQPSMLQPLMRTHQPPLSGTSEAFPKPLLPNVVSRAYDGLSFRSLEGRSASLADFRGRVVFLSLWSAACAPCVRQLPGIERLRNSLKDEGVSFVLLSSDDGAYLRSFLKDNVLHAPVYVVEQREFAQLSGGGLPVTLIFDPRGSVAFKQAGPVNWDDDETRAFVRGLENK